MPNLVGMWNPDLSEDAVRTTLRKQLDRVRVPGIAYEEYQVAAPGFGMALMDHGILGNGRQPVESPDGRFSLLLDGELYNAAELKRRYRKDLTHADPTDAELCLQLITQYDADVVRQFSGLFVVILYDGQAKRAVFISDRFGFRSLFYAHRGSALVFGSELKAICAVDPMPRQVDGVGTLELFCYGCPVIERTWLEGYFRLQPATILEADQAGVRSRRYWLYEYDESAPVLDQPTYVTGSAVLTDRAVERCMRGSRRIGIFLSGGYDSRVVAAAIRKHHLPIPAFTFGHSESRDVRYAAMMAARLGLDHNALTDQSPYLYANCRAIVWRTEGMGSFANTTSIRFHPLLKGKVEIVLVGFLAEYSGSHTWPGLLAARTRGGAMQAVFERLVGRQVPTARRIFQPQFFDDTLDALRARFYSSFEKIRNEHPQNLSDSWRFNYLDPRSSFHSTSIDRYLFEVRAPLLDLDLVEFQLRIPPRHRLEQRVYKQMIAYSFPTIRDVPCTNSGKPIDPHFAREYAAMTLRFLGRSMAAPVRRMLSSKQPLGREFRDLNEDFRAEPELVDRILRPLLAGGVFPAQIFRPEGIEEVITEHYERNGRHEGVLGRLISWALAAKYFLHDEFGDVPASIYEP